MKDLFNKIIIFVSLLLIILILPSCHGRTVINEFEIPDELDTSEIINLTFWAKNDSNINQKNIYLNAIENFNKYYPNIHVEMKSYTDYNDIYRDVITNISTKTTPNICITYPDHIATYLESSATVVPLDNLINDEKYGLGGSAVLFDEPTKDEMVEKFLDEEYLKGSYYAIPFMRSSECLYINKTYLDEHGYTIPDEITWDWIFETSAKIKENTPEGETMIPFIYKSTDNMMIQMLKQLNASYCSEQGDIQLINDTSKQIVQDLSEYASTKAFSTFGISSYPADYLNKGQCVFAIDSTAGATWMGSNCPLLDIDESEVVQFETIVREIPQYDWSNKQMISQGPSICIFNKDNDQEVLASWLFVEYLLTNEVQVAYSKTEGYIPVTSKAINSEEYQEYLSLEGTDNDEHYDIKIEAAKLVIKNIDNTFITPVFNGSADVRKAAGQLIEQGCRKARTLKRALTDEEINDVFKNVNDLYKLNIRLNDMPKASIVLLSSLGIIWVILAAIFIRNYIRKKKHQQNE